MDFSSMMSTLHTTQDDLYYYQIAEYLPPSRIGMMDGCSPFFRVMKRKREKKMRKNRQKAKVVIVRNTRGLQTRQAEKIWCNVLIWANF